MLNNYKLIIAYDGTRYGGWQIQPNAISIQALIQEALHTIVQHDVILIGSGRTDAGVHALGQVGHFKSGKQLSPNRLLASLNGLLPKDIRILHVEHAEACFHAQHSAVSKTYHYHLSTNRIQDPFNRFYCLHVREALDVQRMTDAASMLVGTHDFSAFANEAHAGSAARNPVRTLMRLDVIQQGTEIHLELEANGFLYKMVRNIVGTLLEIAKGKRPVNDCAKILAACDRRLAGQAAPPHGLCLHSVNYLKSLHLKASERLV